MKNILSLVAMLAVSISMAYDAPLVRVSSVSGGVSENVVREIVDAKLTNMVNHSNSTFSNEVLSVALCIDTNSVAEINQLVESLGGVPIGGAATTLAAIIAALAVAVTWLKNNKANADMDADAWVSTRADYKIGNYVTYAGYMWRCKKDNPTASDKPDVEGSEYWEKKRFADPDYQLGIEEDGTLAIVKNDSEQTVTWSERNNLPYNLASESSSELKDRTNNYFAAAGSGTPVSLTMPAAVEGKCRDFGLCVENTSTTTELTIEFTGLSTGEFKFDIAEGDNLTDMTTIAAGTRVEFYFSEQPKKDNLPCFMVVRKTFAAEASA